MRFLKNHSPQRNNSQFINSELKEVTIFAKVNTKHGAMPVSPSIEGGVGVGLQ
jgi:hypothetical protein